MGDIQQQVHQSLLSAVHRGNWKETRNIINCFGLSYSPGWSNGYVLLVDALKRKHSAVAELLLTSGSKVNSRNSIIHPTDTPLHLAAKNGNIEIVEMILDRGANIDAKNRFGYTPLHIATECEENEVTELLSKRGASVNARDDLGTTPLHIATRRGRESVVKLLLEHEPQIDNQDSCGKTILYLAVERGSLMIVEEVLKYCPDINDASNRNSMKIAVHGCAEKYKEIVEGLLEYGFIIEPIHANDPKFLHAAAEKGYLKIVEDSVKNGANVNMLLDSFTPLHSAAKNKQEEVAKLLISFGAEINAQDKAGKTPIYYATKNADFKIFKLLLSNRADFKYKPELLYIAVQKEVREMIEALLQHDADINASDEYGRTALHFAALCDNESFSSICHPSKISIRTDNSESKGEIAKLLLSKGANVNAKQKDGMTALHLAAQGDHKEIVQVLLECGAKVNCKMNNDTTPLHLCAEKDNREIIEIILKFGADINSRDGDGNIALHYASKEAVATLLLEHGSDINIECKYNYKRKMRSCIRSETHLWIERQGMDSYTPFLQQRHCQQHIVKMKAANLYLSKTNLLSMTRHDDMQDFRDECDKEIAIMKREKINNANISFYDILAKGTSSLAIYMRNENIVQILKSDEYETKFPIYACLIKSQYRKGLKRKQLLELGNKIFDSLFNNLPQLPHDSIERILSYLSEEDLRLLVDACKFLSISSPNNNKIE